MVRVKRGTTANKRRKGILKYTKGFCWGRKSKFKADKDAIRHAWGHAFKDRRVKKRTFRRLWQIRINAACREQGIPYNQLIFKLKEKNIIIDRKVLSELTETNPEIFNKIISELK